MVFFSRIILEKLIFKVSPLFLKKHNKLFGQLGGRFLKIGRFPGSVLLPHENRFLRAVKKLVSR